MDITYAQVWSDHAVSVGEPGETITVTVLSGDTVYYGDQTVSASSSLGSIAQGQSVTMPNPLTWLRSASQSFVRVAGQAAQSGQGGGSGIPTTPGFALAEGQFHTLTPVLQTNQLSKFSPARLTATNAAAPLTIATLDSSGQVVEPAVEYIPEGWQGYKYWALITGYTNGNASTENPSLYCSADGLSFIYAPGVTNPIMAAPTGQGANSHNDDPDLVYGPDGKLHLFWIQYDQTPNTTSVYWCTYDGATVSSPQVLWTNVNTTEAVIAPIFMWDGVNNQWVCWYTDAANYYNSVSSPYLYKRRTCSGASPGGIWSAATTTTVSGPANLSIWESHIARRGAELHIVATWCTIMTGGVGTSLYFGTSTDGGLTWTFGTSPLLAASNAGWDSGRMYRADIVPLDDGSDNVYAMWYSACATADGTGAWYMAYTTITATNDPLDRVVAPVWGPVLLGASTNPAANEILLVRVFVKKTGTLMSFNYYCCTAVGNVIAGVYDTGDVAGAAADTITQLWASSSQAMVGANAWQTMGHPRLQVTKGQELYLALQFSGSTASIGRFSTAIAGSGMQLPGGFLSVPGAVQPKLAAVDTAVGSFGLPSTIAEANLTLATFQPVFICAVE